MWDLQLPYDAVKNSARLKILMDNDMLSLPFEVLIFHAIFSGIVYKNFVYFRI